MNKKGTDKQYVAVFFCFVFFKYNSSVASFVPKLLRNL